MRGFYRRRKIERTGRIWRTEETVVRAIYTIGYEGTDLTAFLSTLRVAGIHTLIDVRDRPLSRKRGFSKSALGAALSAVGISYLHMPALGDPKPGREAARRGEYQLFKEIFGQRMASAPAQEALATLEELARQENVCLLCFERDPHHCHRHIIADHLKRESGFLVHHLGVQDGRGKDAIRWGNRLT